MIFTEYHIGYIILYNGKRGTFGECQYWKFFKLESSIIFANVKSDGYIKND